jgi:hypothetical protein
MTFFYQQFDLEPAELTFLLCNQARAWSGTKPPGILPLQGAVVDGHAAMTGW